MSSSPILLPPKAKEIVDIKFFSYNRLAVISKKGLVCIYDLPISKNISLLYSMQCPLESGEVVTSFDFFATGELFVIGTSEPFKNQVCRIIAFKHNSHAKDFD